MSQQRISNDMGERLQKVLAHAGVASRRAAEEMILAQRVTVNGKIVTELGTRVYPTDSITVDNKPIQVKEKHSYILLYKPVGVITSVKDPRGRKTVLDLINNRNTRLYPIGRLDYDTSGLLLLTNDGEVAYRLTHPRYGVKKTYLVGVKKPMSKKALLTLADGVELEDGITAPAKVKYLGSKKEKPTFSPLLFFTEITIHEGRNRQVRRMFAKVGFPVFSLHRVKFGPLTLDSNLKPGDFRSLKPMEIEMLKKEVNLL